MSKDLSEIPPQGDIPGDGFSPPVSLPADEPLVDASWFEDSSATVLQPLPEEPDYYTYADPPPNPSLVAPFGVSLEIPIGAPSSEQMVPPAQPLRSPGKRPSLLFLAIIVCVVVIGGLLVVNALAQPGGPPMQVKKNPLAQVNQPTKMSQIQGNAPNGVPQPLPAGWTAAGLSTADGIESMRTAVTFTDREMSLDFRSAGTRNNHGGTFTAATFLLTPASKQRFLQNDARVINNALWDKVQQEKLVQSEVNVQTQLVQFAKSGQQQFAWVDVSFQLFQSKVVGGQPMEGLDGTIHHMMVILLRALPQNAGAPMGGTGWLVNTYALDLPTGTQLNIVIPA